MNTARSNRMKDHWQRCETIGNFLGIIKNDINRFYTDLNRLQLIEPLLAGDPEAKKNALMYIEKNTPQKVLKFVEPENPDPPSDARDFNLAFWYIKKVGDVERAEKIMTAAIKAVRSLHK